MSDIVHISFPHNLETIGGGNFVRLKPSVLKIEPSSDNTKVKRESVEYQIDKNMDDKIVIYLPINLVEDSVSNNWTGVENMQLLVGDGSGMGSIAQYLGNMAMNNAGTLLNSMKNKAVGGMFGTESGLGNFFKESSVPKEVVMAIRHSLLGGAGVNPHEMMVYEGVERRTVNLNYDKLIPSSKKEEDALKLLHTILDRVSRGSYGEYALIAPPLWDIDFFSLPADVSANFDANENVTVTGEDLKPFFGLEKCIIQNFSCKHGGGTDKFTKMKSGMPLKHFSLSLMESEPKAITEREGGMYNEISLSIKDFMKQMGG